MNITNDSNGRIVCYTLQWLSTKHKNIKDTATKIIWYSTPIAAFDGLFKWQDPRINEGFWFPAVGMEFFLEDNKQYTQ